MDRILGFFSHYKLSLIQFKKIAKFSCLISLFLFLSKDSKAQSCCTGRTISGNYRLCILVSPIEGYTYGKVFLQNYGYQEYYSNRHLTYNWGSPLQGVSSDGNYGFNRDGLWCDDANAKDFSANNMIALWVGIYTVAGSPHVNIIFDDTSTETLDIWFTGIDYPYGEYHGFFTYSCFQNYEINYDDDLDTFAECDGDCNDSLASVNPDAFEVCNGIDDDCDNFTDEGYSDGDGDGYKGGAGSANAGCGDCNDADPNIHPGAVEVCDGIDQNCVNGTDDEPKNTCIDYSTCMLKQTCDACEPTPQEICNDKDDDCNNVIDDGFDLDSDGYSAPCENDCDDSNAAINPGAPEICDGVDNNCNGSIDESSCIEPPPEPDKDECGTAGTGDPVNVTTGGAEVSSTDFHIKGIGIDIDFVRTYDSQLYYDGPLGYGWTHSFNIFLRQLTDGRIMLFWKDGRMLYFTPDVSGYLPPKGEDFTLISVGALGYVLTDKDGINYLFNNSGRLENIYDAKGNTITLTYDFEDKLEMITGDNGIEILLCYGDNKKLWFVDFSDYLGGSCMGGAASLVDYNYTRANLTQVLIGGYWNTSEEWVYLYEDLSDPNNLTQVTHPVYIPGQDLIYEPVETFEYYPEDKVQKHCVEGRCFTFSYDAVNLQTTVTNLQTNEVSIITYTPEGVTTNISGECYCGGSTTSTWDTSGNALNRLSFTDKNGYVTRYSNHDFRGRAQLVEEGCIWVNGDIDCSGADVRRTYYQYHPFLDATLEIRRESVLGTGDKVTTFDYDNPSDSNDDITIPNQNPTALLYRIIEEGFTTDSNGNIIPYRYETKYSYNSLNQVISIDGPRDDISDVNTFAYYSDSFGEGANRKRLQSIINPDGTQTTFLQYDYSGNPINIQDANGNYTFLTYNTKGKLLDMTIQNQDGTEVYQTFYEYNIFGKLWRIRLPKGNIIEYWYSNNKISYITRVNNDGIKVETITFGYDGEGNRISEVYHEGDENGPVKKSLSYLFDNFNRLWKAFNPNNPSFYTEFFYDSKGNRTKMVDDNLNTTEYLPDNLDRLIKVTQWLTGTQSAATEYQYNQNDDLTQVKDAEGHITNYLYDDMGRLVQATSPDTGITRYWYDASGNLIGKNDANGKRIEYSYDALNRLTSIVDTTNPASPVTLVTYYYDGANPHSITVTNGIGRLTGMSDASGIVTWSYDIRGNIIEERRTLGTQTFVTSYEWDANGNISRIIYPDNRVVEYVNSTTDVDRVAEIKTTVNGVTTTVASGIQYEPYGDVKSLTYGNGANLNITRDLRYQITGIKVTGTSGDIINRTDTMDYVGNITSITDNLEASKSQAFSYDNFYRLTSASGPYGEITYSYDLVGNRLQQVKPNKTIDYFYNTGTNQLSQFTDPLNKNTDKNKLRQDYKKLINDLRHIIEDEWDRNCVSNDPKKICWAYGSFMNRVSAVMNESGVDTAAFMGLFIGNTIIQDNLTQLLNRVNEGTPFALIEDEDARLYRNILDEMNQVVVHSPDLKPKDPTLVYDNNGNIIEESVSGTKLIYDSLGRLIRVADINDATIAEYTYDATNKRVSKTAFGITTIFIYDLFGNLLGEYTTGGSLIRDYIYLGNKPIALISLPEGFHFGPIGCPSICAISGGKFTTGTAVNGLLYFSPFIFLLCWRLFRRRKYSIIYASLLTGVTVVILIILAKKAMAQGTNEQIYYYHTDHLGTPIMLTDSNQAIAWDATYDPFGKANITVSSVTNNLRFPGQYYDAETGLHYNWNRYYWPEVGRYITPDPIITILKEEPQVNTIYLYTINNPLKYIDPFGLLATCTFSVTGRNISCRSLGCSEKVKEVNCYAYSGDSNPFHEDLINIGPLPRGTYEISRPGYIRHDGVRIRWISLRPLFRTHRYGFAIHTGSITEGCILIQDISCFTRLFDFLLSESIWNKSGQLLVTF